MDLRVDFYSLDNYTATPITRLVQVLSYLIDDTIWPLILKRRSQQVRLDNASPHRLHDLLQRYKRHAHNNIEQLAIREWPSYYANKAYIDVQVAYTDC